MKTLNELKREIRSQYIFALRNKIDLRSSGHILLFRDYQKNGGKLSYRQIVKGVR
jgi:hypothetical protein